jgi:alkylation response protein AidB-like acyl-CoA dehydrogenase
MPQYKAPIRDISFVIRELFDFNQIRKLPGVSEVGDDLVDAILTESARLCENVLFPLNQSGDEEGCHWDNGEVKTPKGFKEAYRQFSDGGWSALACDPAYGGQGLPNTLEIFMEEMTCSANISFGLYPGLTRGAYTALQAHGAEELKTKYLPNMVSGKWAGTMNLTEPHCGTDLGLLRTKAVPQEDGSYKITGTKIFISSGEHDLTENIIHLVLARTPDAPAGTKGISLFVVPKILVKEDGSLGDRNGVKCGSIEHKMGIKASSTCVMNYDEATGWLVGDLNKGLNHMFVMMNNERLSVGMQGLGVAEVAYQNALAYARERLQGRALTGAKFPDKVADPLLVHPDIRRMLLTMKAYNEGNRMLAGWTAHEMDIAHRSTDPEEAMRADDFLQLMTPIVKAFFTDTAFEGTNMAVQVFGGYGYIRDYGVEQYVRDARIAQIYEGTNGIQALDLVGRKMGAHMGRYLRQFFHPIQAFLEEYAAEEEWQEFIIPLAKAFERLQRACLSIAQKGMANPDEGGAAATDLLSLFGHVALGYLWTRAAMIAKKKIQGSEGAYYISKYETAQFYTKKLLPKTSALFSSIMGGASCVMQMTDEKFGPFEFAGFSEQMAQVS